MTQNWFSNLSDTHRKRIIDKKLKEKNLVIIRREDYKYWLWNNANPQYKSIFSYLKYLNSVPYVNCKANPTQELQLQLLKTTVGNNILNINNQILSKSIKPSIINIFLTFALDFVNHKGKGKQV
jgi:hypothetical protein